MLARSVIVIALVLSASGCSSEPTTDEATCEAQSDAMEAFFDAEFDRYIEEANSLAVVAGRADDQILRDVGTNLADTAELWKGANFADDDLFLLNLDGLDLLNERCIELGY